MGGGSDGSCPATEKLGDVVKYTKEQREKMIHLMLDHPMKYTISLSPMSRVQVEIAKFPICDMPANWTM